MQNADKFDKTLDQYAWNSQLPYKITGQNTIFLGKDLRTKHSVIIKVFPLSQFSEHYLLTGLLEDFHRAKALKNPHLVEIFSVFLTKHSVYLVEEYCPDGSLRTFINNRKKDLEKTRTFFHEALQALEFLESRGISHGNLKPENMLISSGTLKLNDFVIKPKLFRKNPNHNYQSPGQLTKKTESFPLEHDLWALACVFFEVFQGNPLFFALTERESRENFERNPVKIGKFDEKAEVPQDFVEFFEGVLEKGWKLEDLLRSKLLGGLRGKNGKMLKSVATLNELDYNSMVILKGIEETIKKNKLDLEALFKKLDSSGDQTLDCGEFQTLLKLVDPKLDVEQIEHVFRVIDRDESGSITLEEFKNLMNLNSSSSKPSPSFLPNADMELRLSKMMYVFRETIARNSLDFSSIFSKYDSSGDQNLDQKEFTSLIKAISPSTNEQDCEYLFKKLDFDGSGDLNIQEFKSYVFEDKELERKLKEIEENTQKTIEFIKRMLYGQKLDLRKLFSKADRKNKGKINKEEFRELLKLVDNSIKDEVIRHMYKKLDKDGSGLIDYEEFSEFFK